jgi:DNA-binding transcriptional regulator YiaG
MSVMAKKLKTSTYTAEQIKAIRERLKLTQAQAAERVGVARRTWQDWENGKIAVPLPITKLLDCLEKLSKKSD